MMAFMAEFESLGFFSTWDDFPWNGPVMLSFSHARSVVHRQQD